MYSNADTFIGSIECIMCYAIISPISQPKHVAKEVKKSKKETKNENPIYMCGHDWCTFSIRQKEYSATKFQFDTYCIYRTEILM